MSPEERRARAIRIQALMEQDELRQAFDDVKAVLTDEWSRCHDPDGRENLWRAVNIADRLQTWMHAAAHDPSLTPIKRVGK